MADRGHLSGPDIAANKLPVNDEERQLLLEISKTLLSGTLATTRGSMQVLQGLAGILLASYTTLLVGFGKQVGIDRIPILIAGGPIAFYIASLLVGFGQTMLYRGARIRLGDLESGMEAYEAVVSAQRKQLILPSIFLFLGLIAVVIVILDLMRS
jgi:hypothetical protein